MLSLVRKTPVKLGGWPAMFRLCAVLWTVAVMGFSYSVLQCFGLLDLAEFARRWRLVTADGNQLVIGGQFAFLTLVFFAMLFTCYRLSLLRSWAAVVLSAFSWYCVFMFSLGTQVWTVCLVSLIAIPLTVSTIFGRRQMRNDV